MTPARASPAFQLAILSEDEKLDAFGHRFSGGAPSIVFLGARERAIAASADQTQVLLAQLLASKAYLATKHPGLARQARAKGIRVIDRTADLKEMLEEHPQLQEALRLFSPHVWRQQLQAQLQRMGLVTMPSVRIYSLVALSVALFGFVVFRLLPSAEIHVQPRQETVAQTVNVFLVRSGAVLPASRVRMLPMQVLDVEDMRTLTFDQISKQFIGTPAVVDFEIHNASAEDYTLQKTTRFQNQAGMVFRTLAAVHIPAGATATMRAKADETDAYGQIIGARGNVPAGVLWDIPGLAPQERTLVTAVNPAAASGGTTAYRTVLSAQDLEIAKKRLEQELLATAKRLVDEEVEGQNALDPERDIRLLRYGELTKLTYTGFVIPTQFIGQEVASVPIEGGIRYTAHAYEAQSILDFLHAELESHVRDGKRLLGEALTGENLIVHVIDYADDLSWIKLTVDLSATEEYILDPLTPDGALFAKRVRDQVVGLSVDEALRIVRNMPEVETARVSIWPPWNRHLPAIPAHISITPEE